MAVAISPLLCGCTRGWNSWPSPPPKEPELENGQVGRAVDTMTYAPATLAGDQHLGVAFNRKLELVGQEKLHDSPLRTHTIGEFDARWSFHDLSSAKKGELQLGVPAIAGLRGSIGLEKGSSYAIFSFEELDYCTAIDEAVEFGSPERGRYFSVEICYGRRFSRIYSSTTEVLMQSLTAELFSFPIGDTAHKTSSGTVVSIREYGEGLRRDDDCDTMNFAELKTVGDCFVPGPARPMRVRWGKIERRSKKAARAPHRDAGA